MIGTQKDTQRQKVYRWERSLAKHYNVEMWLPKMNLKECEQFSNKIWNKYKNKFSFSFNDRYDYCSKIKIKKVSGNTCSMRSGFYSMGKKQTKDGKNRWYKKMHLCIYGQNKYVLIHEISHALAPRNSMHDKYFVGIYMFLMAEYLNYNLKYMIEQANLKGIDFTFKYRGQFKGYVLPLERLVKKHLK
jgi:hypothetical protein